MNMNFILTEMTFLRYFIPLIQEGNKHGISSTLFVGRSGKYNCPQLQNHKIQLLKLSKEHSFGIQSIHDLKNSNDINFSIEACGVNYSSQKSKNIVLTYQNDFRNKNSPTGLSNYYKFLDSVDYVIFPSLFFATHYNCLSDKNLYLGSPKYDVHLDRNKIIQKYKIEKDKNVLVLFPKKRDENKINIREIYDSLKSLGYNIIVKTRGKDRVYDEFLRGDHYFEDFSWYPHSTMELISISDFVVNFGSTSNKECVMLRKPIVNFEVKPKDVNFGNDCFDFLNQYDYCINISLSDYTKELATSAFLQVSGNNYNSFDISIKNHLFDYNSSNKIINFIIGSELL